MESWRKGVYFINLFTLCLSKHMPEKLKTCREYSEAARDSKEERGETKLSLIFMYKLK